MLDPAIAKRSRRLPDTTTCGRPCRAAWSQVHKQPGEAITRGETLVTIESMKLQIALLAPRDGRLARSCAASATHSTRTRSSRNSKPLGGGLNDAPYLVHDQRIKRGVPRNAAHNRRSGESVPRPSRRQHAYRRPQRDLERLARQGKMRPRERIEKLLDPGTPFLELSSLAANMAYGGESPSASTIVGIGIVSGREVMVRADDPTVKGGAWYPLSAKKIVRALDIAIENRLPVIHLCDSAGGFLQLQSEVFPDRYMAGRIFRNQSVLSKMGVKQLALVFGHCTAGGAYIPALSDYNVIVRGTGAVFLGGPPLVRAATGEEVTVEELGGADMHTSVSGVCDYPAANEERGHPDRPRDRLAMGAGAQVGVPTRAGRRAGLRSARDLRHPARRHQEAVRHARDHRAHRRRQPLPRIPAQLRHDADLRLSPTSGASRSESSPTTACCSTILR